MVLGDGRVSTYELGDRDLVIGRGEGCDVVIDHVTLSRRHAVVRGGTQLTVQDLGSTNGTRVGGELRHGGEPVPIVPGESFQIGAFALIAMSRDRGDARSASGTDMLTVVDPTVSGVPPLVHDIAASPASVLVFGETGVGKDVLAETIHALSGRSGPLVRINCAAMSQQLFEGELFGFEKGAFTGAVAAKPGLLEAAQGGTVFLDEIGELPPSTQPKLLRAVEQREVLRIGAVRPMQIDVRFVAATHRDLPADVLAGRFRSDLLFRLHGVSLTIPPLRERRAMIGALALRFLHDACRRDGRPAARLGTDVLHALEAYHWPGNVRELRAVIDRALLFARGADPQVRHLAFTPESAPAPPAPAPAPAAAVAGPPGVSSQLNDDQRADRDRIVQALAECAGNQSRAARLLGISRTTLITKMRAYRIPRPRV